MSLQAASGCCSDAGGSDGVSSNCFFSCISISHLLGSGFGSRVTGCIAAFSRLLFAQVCWFQVCPSLSQLTTLGAVCASIEQALKGFSGSSDSDRTTPSPPTRIGLLRFLQNSFEFIRTFWVGVVDSQKLKIWR